MPGITYYLLTEAEPFSEFAGGAISRWAGNVLRSEPNSVVVCPWADGSWNFPQESIQVLPGLARYKHFRRYLQRLPWFLHRQVIRAVFRPLLTRVRSGDIVWIHNRPEFAIAITALVQRAGGRVVLHLHNSHLVERPERLMKRVCVDRLVFVSEFLRQQARTSFLAWALHRSYITAPIHRFSIPPWTGSGNAETATVLFAGRLVEDKGIHILLDAMRLLEQEGVRLQAHIVGSSGFGMGKETDYTRRPERKLDCERCVSALL